MKSFVTIGVSAALLAQVGLCAVAFDKNDISADDVVLQPVKQSVKYGPFTIPAANPGEGAVTAMPSKSNIELPYVSARIAYFVSPERILLDAKIARIHTCEAT
jgi:hypothetical protein